MTTILRILCLCGVLLPLAAADDDLAVVVNKSNPVDNLTKAQLRKIILGDQASWPTGKRVIVVLRSPANPSARVFCAPSAELAKMPSRTIKCRPLSTALQPSRPRWSAARRPSGLRLRPMLARSASCR